MGEERNNAGGEAGEVLAGGGESGARLRAIDWPRTPLGPVSGWPPALRVAVGLVLRSPLPKVLWWGPALVAIHNDAGGPLAGAVQSAWEPTLRAGLAGQEPTPIRDLPLLIDRQGSREEVHFQVAFSPVPDGTVRPTGLGGVLATAVETTGQVRAARQWKTLRELAASASRAETLEQACQLAATVFEGNPFDVPFALFYLLVEPSGTHARLAASSGFGGAARAQPREIDLRVPEGEGGWPVARLLRTQAAEVLADLPAGLGPLPTGAWKEPPGRALALPLSSPDPLRPYGVLIAGCSPHRPLDEEYRTFLELAAAQVVTAIRHALPYDEQRREAQAPIVLEAEAALRGQERILVVEDDADTRESLVHLLRQRWMVEAAASGEEALAAVRGRRFDLVLTDVLMPGLGGLGLLREIRKDPATRPVRVILLSARVGEEARSEGMEATADDYIEKPFSARELMARVATRLELHRLQERLERGRAAVEDLFSRSPAPVAIFRGPELVVDFANEAAVQVISPGHALLGRPLLEVIPELGDQGLHELLLQVMRTGVPYVGRDRRVRLTRPDGSVRETCWTFLFAPLCGVGGRVEAVVAIATDVTAHVEARRRLAIAAREAREASRAKDEFLAMLGHELRNPLAPILTALQLMKLRGAWSREQRIIERQVEHLSRLVDDLLDVSRITRGKVELRKRPVELAEVVLRAMEMVSPLLEQRRHRLEVNVPRPGLGVNADPERLAQVISNLLNNASKYSDLGSLIQVQAEREGGLVRLRVKDQGVGIAPEMLGRVFDLFVQQPQTLDRSRGGLGLGLTIVRSLVEAHGGKVRAHSEGAGKGSELVVELPAVDLPAERAVEEAAPPPPPPPRERPARGHRILVVDDNEDAAQTLKEALEELGYTVELALDGPQALRVTESFHPDVALVDIGLPVMDGYELASRLRRRPGLHLVAVTGYGLESDRQRSAAAGFEEHLVKPVDLDRLERVVEGLPYDA